ncbi:MAG: alpha/beta hydrolase [Candidatus Binataceae bacterium]|jgi:dienelactone hydrolase
METSRPLLRRLLREGRVLNELLAFGRAGRAAFTTGQAEQPQTILLIPGFLAGDLSLYPLAHRLRDEGHSVRFAGITANIACSRRQIARLERVLHETADEAGQPVVIIGHSLGGIYARALAHRMPDVVAQTFLLGSPVRESLKHTNPFVRMLFIATRQPHVDGTTCASQISTLCGIHVTEPPKVPSTLIYSKSDGVVSWAACLEFGPQVEAIEVRSTHCGIPYNLETLRIISERVRRIGRTSDAQANSHGNQNSNSSTSRAQGH